MKSHRPETREVELKISTELASKIDSFVRAELHNRQDEWYEIPGAEMLAAAYIWIRNREAFTGEGPILNEDNFVGLARHCFKLAEEKLRKRTN